MILRDTALHFRECMTAQMLAAHLYMPCCRSLCLPAKAVRATLEYFSEFLAASHISLFLICLDAPICAWEESRTICAVHKTAMLIDDYCDST